MLSSSENRFQVPDDDNALFDRFCLFDPWNEKSFDFTRELPPLSISPKYTYHQWQQQEEQELVASSPSSSASFLFYQLTASIFVRIRLIRNFVQSYPESMTSRFILQSVLPTDSANHTSMLMTTMSCSFPAQQYTIFFVEQRISSTLLSRVEISEFHVVVSKYSYASLIPSKNCQRLQQKPFVIIMIYFGKCYRTFAFCIILATATAQAVVTSITAACRRRVQSMSYVAFTAEHDQNVMPCNRGEYFI
ncbi:hypothetical protein X798_02667 [Onchocerca flexuosa]|uniref:Uncharacterized protein n=1 Tax=Onchocerca flexuosa TaxID=387005 RepID=A0A238C058_9BILA|nr:hypothetical protein X798_02667 [Onchocerca flexuosa]